MDVDDNCLATSAAVSPVRIEVNFSQTRPGDYVALVGASLALGAWKVPLRLDPTCWPQWTATVPFSALDRSPFKLVVIRGGSAEWTWEPLSGNRVLLCPVAHLVLKWGVASVIEEELDDGSMGLVHTHASDVKTTEVFFRRGDVAKPPRALFVFFDGQFIFKEHYNQHTARKMSLFAGKALPPSCVGVSFWSDVATRSREYNLFGEPGDVGDFSKWVVETELPRIRAMYGFDESPTFLVGSSFGATAALYTLNRYPTTFSGAICMSISFRLTKLSQCVSDNNLDERHRVYFDCGADELGFERWTSEAYLAVGKLARKPVLKMLTGAEGGHDEESWGRRLPRAVSFCLGDELQQNQHHNHHHHHHHK